MFTSVGKFASHESKQKNIFIIKSSFNVIITAYIHKNTLISVYICLYSDMYIIIKNIYVLMFYDCPDFM